MSNSNVEINTEEFSASVKNATYQVWEKLVQNMNKVSLAVEAEAKKECPIDTGVLRASMTSKVDTIGDEVIGVIGNSCKYAPYVHNGTGIYAKNGGGRRTPWKNVALDGKYKGGHITSGQKPNPFLERARQNKINDIVRILSS